MNKMQKHFSANASKERAVKIVRTLKKEYPHAKTSLRHSKPLEILVAVILSAQCTDRRVNMITAELFKKYKTAADYAAADSKKLESEIRSAGFYRSKAKNIIGSAKKILVEFGGKVPDSIESLSSLPGVARKTANIVLYSGFGKIEGIAVDTHVRRLSQRLGLSKNDDPLKIERDLIGLIPKKDWGLVSFLLIEHGRKICSARNPLHNQCVLAELCPSSIKWRKKWKKRRQKERF